MKKYIHYMQTERTTHQRRQAALQIASITTVLVFVGWIATLGIRLSTAPVIAEEDNTAQLVANVESGINAMQSGFSNSPYYQPPAANY